MEFNKAQKIFIWIITVLVVIFGTLVWYNHAKAAEQQVYTVLELPLPVQGTKPLWTQEEIDCAARMVYGEARGVGFPGKVAVAAVAIQRASDGRRYSMNLCTVVKQKHQFAGYRDHVRPRNSIDRKAYQECYLAVARAMAWHTLPASYRGNYFFNSPHEPRFTWAAVRGRLDGHLFYGAAA